jgi:hypothetical protein
MDEVEYDTVVWIYLDEDMTELTRTSQFNLDEDRALDMFTQVAEIQGSRPRYLQVKRPGEKLRTLPFVYNYRTDTVHPMD